MGYLQICSDSLKGKFDCLCGRFYKEQLTFTRQNEGNTQEENISAMYW